MPDAKKDQKSSTDVAPNISDPDETTPEFTDGAGTEEEEGVVDSIEPEKIEEPKPKEEMVERFDKHPRFIELNNQKNEYKAKAELLTKEIEELKKNPPKIINIDIDDENEESEIKIMNKIEEKNFLKSLDISNSYDGDKILNSLKPIAKILYKQGKTLDYESALRKAYAIENLNDEIENQIAMKMKGKKTVLASVGTGSVRTEPMEDGLTSIEMRAARKMGLTPSEYKKFL